MIINITSNLIVVNGQKYSHREVVLKKKWSTDHFLVILRKQFMGKFNFAS